jgi:hypothetical protein
MNKTVRAALIIGVVLMMIAGIIYLETQAKTYASDVEEYKSSLAIEEANNSRLNKRVNTLKSRNENLILENDRLTRQNAILRDSVKVLHASIKKLNGKIQEQTALITGNEAKMKQFKKQSEELVNKVHNLSKDKNVDKKLIADLDKQRQELDKKIGNLFEENLVIENKALDETKKLADLTKQYDDKERVLNIVEMAKVNFKNLYPRRDESRRARNIGQWKLTVADLELVADDINLIQGETFVVKILDKDTGKVMSPREASGSSNDTQGKTFVFKGNPIPTIQYSNYQEKTGKNYLLQVFYEKDGKNYPLKNGSKDIAF